jgi:hypothetical protein
VHRPTLRLAAGAAVVAAFVLGGVAAPAAHAAITGSRITSPTDPSFFVADEDAATQTFSIAGTTSGGKPGSDKVDLRCYHGSTSVKVAGNVALKSNGSFSVPKADLNTVDGLTCLLRAVPAGTKPGNVTPYVGVVIGVGDRNSASVGGGVNNGKVYDYALDAQQQTGVFDYVSLGNCGLFDGFLYGPKFVNTTVTYACNGGLLGRDSAAASTRSDVQIDGSNAYAPAAAFLINSNATGLPTLTYTYTVDKATGNVAIRESDPLVKCPTATYPPTAASCSNFVPTGVTDDRTITQDHDGHISWITDTLTSTDSASHAVDLLWNNSQRFWGPSGDSTQLEYRFPGQSGFAKHVKGDAVPLSATAAPGTVLIRMGGAPDGDVSTGQGAIVYDRPAAAANFTLVTNLSSDFTLHQAGTVPAGGSTRFRFAYVQDYLAADVSALAQTASTAFLNTVAVSKSGKGNGTITSSPGGILCGKTCSHGFGYGTSLTLTAKPAKGSRLAGWSGACKGARKCRVPVTGNATVKAKFVLRPCVVPNVVGKPLKAAKLTLRKRFCSVGKVTSTPSTLAKGRVVSQSPKRGTALRQNGKVDLVVSEG